MKPKIEICMGSSCFARGNKNNLQAIMAYLAANNLQDGTDVVMSGDLCQERCCKGPNIKINEKLFTVETPTAAIELIKSVLKKS